ncbi:MAG: T9SS type A sorting domain-containing protein [Candidatus Cloacimonetes bacterium]|nr:T9SS type A sorting domain-containing protein [Candidatus Cloacimonadota bacterium]
MITLVCAVVLWASATALFAVQPHIDVSLANSLPIPHAYDEVIKLESGDLQFYKFTVSDGNIQIAGFQYLTQSYTFTELVQIGTITGFEGTAFKEIGTQRFGKFYVIYQYPEIDPQVLIIIRLDTYEFEYRIIDNMPLFDYYDGFHASSRIEIVSEDHLIIALADRLEFYDFASNTSRTILDGEDFRCKIGQRKRVYAMPTGHFMYVKDTCENFTLETWFIFDSQGNLLFTKIMTDFWFSVSVTGSSFNAYPGLINDRFYIPSYGLYPSDSAILECHFPTPDSLYVYMVPSLFDNFLGLTGFGDNRIIHKHFDDVLEATVLFVTFSPLEFNPEPSHWTYIRSYDLHLDSLNEHILMVSTRYEDHIFISALCTLDFPAPHTFTFPAPTTNIYLSVITFSHNDQLFMISDGTLYAFEVEYSVSNADETAVPPVHTLSAYPNPAKLKSVITFQAASKQRVELDIYNLRGQKVDTITLDAEGAAEWDLRNHKGEAVSAGVYFAKPRNNKDIKPVKFIVIH